MGVSAQASTECIKMTLPSFPFLIMSGSSGHGMLLAKALWASYLLSETLFLL